MRTAVVTGGAGDIGAEICRALGYAGYHVSSVDIEPSDEADTSYIASVTDREALSEYLEQLEFDVLVNCAGITRDMFLHKMPENHWDDVIDINLTGAYNVTRLVIPGMRERKYGRIVNISSVNGCKGQMGQTNYSASKAGLHGFTMALAQESAFKNIMVNTISPGYIETKMTEVLSDRVKADIVLQVPVNRFGKPSDISRTVLFLVDEENTYITGANIPVNGGLYTSF